jgi:hypothetical protein
VTIFESIQSHATLPKGWNYGKGGPLLPLVIQTGINLCEKLIAAGYSFDDMEDFPFSDGRLQVVLFHRSDEYQFLINTKGTFSLTLYDGESFRLLTENKDIDQIFALFESRTKCNSFDIFTSEISARKMEGILEETVLFPTKRAKSPLLTNNVLNTLRGVNVNMEFAITPRSLTPQVSMLSSRHQTFQNLIPSPSRRVNQEMFVITI